MNNLLEKIAQAMTLPYRDRVEVLIINDIGEILLTKNKNKTTGENWYGFPGGGVDDMTERDACIMECLEEVGIRISNVQDLGIHTLQEGGLGSKKNRDKLYRGSSTKWFKADFDSVDKSLYGGDEDERKFVWRSPSEALEAIQSDWGISPYRVMAITSLKASN